ncbi:hypothetical protein BABA_14717 [Neobacillus bataviensis LMG 21833]|uniref:DUF2642 domain-containing protein n=1 Tax=Neobacillus bataviensis LMG 21833 TaxID=1117379 RepID=K6DEH1_9BACI|nr:hypothetical protein [Neobacillus bataviensis]EKN66719.1 hypothetical protein BABA_14717 [Neobacillus bataviensis LMG 21833]
MNEFSDLMGKNIEIEISGGNFYTGNLVDCGLDIIVLYVGRTGNFYYIPSIHIQRMKETQIEENSTYYEQPSEKPLETDPQAISFRRMLNNAKGRFVEVFVTGNKSIHGYLTSIMNDYFVFYSPVYKTVYISMNHVKWLIPYPENATPYSLDPQSLPVHQTKIPLARSFDEQCKKLENQLVIIDGGDSIEKIGHLQKVMNRRLTLITAERETLYRNLEHVKTIYLAN